MWDVRLDRTFLDAVGALFWLTTKSRDLNV